MIPRAAARKAAPATTALALTTPATQQRELMEEVFSATYLQSMMWIWMWPMMTFVPMMWQDVFCPAMVANKIVVLHWMHEKQIDSKLRLALDDCVTEWDSNVERASIDAAVSRTWA